MFARHDKMMGALYGCTHAALSLASFFIAYEIRFHLARLRPLFPLAHYPWIVPLAVAIPAGSGIVLGIYREIAEEDLRRAFADPLKVATASTILLFALTFAFYAVYISRLLVVLYGAIDLLAMVAFRVAARRFAGPLRHGLAGVRTFLLVGDLPEIEGVARTIELHESRRLRMRPGLTCLWALEGRNRLTFRRWMELDLQYIDNWSPGLEWKILLKTITVVLLGRGAS